MSNNIVRHIINLVIFVTKQHVTSMQTPRYHAGNASLLAWKRIATMLLAFTRWQSPCAITQRGRFLLCNSSNNIAKQRNISFNLFPTWKQVVSSMETSCFKHGNNSFLASGHMLAISLVFLMQLFGVSMVWGHDVTGTCPLSPVPCHHWN